MSAREPGSYAGLTVAQADFLSVLRRHQKNGRTPSFQDLSDETGKAKSNVHRLVESLAERGYIERIPNRKRSIRCFAEPVPVNPPTPEGRLTNVETRLLVAELKRRGFEFGGQWK